MIKFNRNYVLQVGPIQTPDDTLIQPPLTMEFDSTRNLFGTANHFSVRVYNMAKAKRDVVRRDKYISSQGNNDLRSLILKAGYGNVMPTVIKGNVFQCWTVREGTNYITEFQGFDAGFAFANSTTQGNFTAGNNSSQAIVNNLANSLTVDSNGQPSGITVGAIGSLPTTPPARGTSLSGNTCDLLTQLTGGAFTIDNGAVHVLSDSECLDGTVLEINPQSGLLGTPLLEQAVVHIEIIFDPRIRMLQLVKLTGMTQPRFNGVYKVVSIHNKGTISQAVSGSATTSLGLLNGNFTPIAAKVVS